MSYEEAIIKVKQNIPMMRQHWCWVRLCYSPFNDTLFLDNEDGERNKWKPLKEDENANDWIIAKF